MSAWPDNLKTFIYLLEKEEAAATMKYKKSAYTNESYLEEYLVLAKESNTVN